jgi:uncharacterized membrane protein
MQLINRRWRQAYGFLAPRAFLPSLLASLLAVALWFGRVYLSQAGTYSFLLWNLILAWVPYLGSLWADHAHSRFPKAWYLLLIPGALWLAFFPNAPYIVTDFWHLAERPPVPLWYDIGFLATFALTGLLLAVFSLRIMQRLVRFHLGSIASWLFVGGAVALGGLGVYLGRFLRWNSWDLFLNPKGVLADVVSRLAHPFDHPRTFGVTLLFAAILFVFYLAFATREPA